LRELYLASDLQLAADAFKKAAVDQYLQLRAAIDCTDALAELVGGAADGGRALRVARLRHAA
jgi:hypothetical protein